MLGEIYKNKKGFTLAELVIVMIITTILVAVAAFSASQTSEKANMKSSIVQVSEILRQIQNYSMTGHEDDGSVPDAYGIFFEDADTYIFFKDLNANDAWDAGETLNTYDLEGNSGFVFADFTPDVCEANNGCSIISQIPGGTFCYDDNNATKGDTDCDADNVVISLSVGELTDDLTLNTYSGKVSY
jgi:prepilin-type N-terminal cleavage/methylation domain-containing protein